MQNLIWRATKGTHEAALAWCETVNARRAKYGMAPLSGLVIKYVDGLYQVYSC
jgi:hypothetical protein